MSTQKVINVTFSATFVGMSIRDLFPIDKWEFKSESVFAGLSDGEFKQLVAYQTEQVYAKGDIIFREGAVPSGIFFIRKGKVKKYKAMRNGGQQIIYIAGAGELIGYHAVLEGGRYPDSAATLESSVISFIPQEDFLQVLGNSTYLMKTLLKALSHEYTVLANSITIFSQRSVKERLALQLVLLREKYKEDFKDGMKVSIDISREDLANLVGTTRENVVRILSSFKSKGIVEANGRKIIIADVLSLIKIANWT